MQKELRRAFGGGDREKARVACLFDGLAAKFLKDDKTLGRKDDKFVSGKEAISRHSERLAKNLRNIVIRFFGLKLLLSSE